MLVKTKREWRCFVKEVDRIFLWCKNLVKREVPMLKKNYERFMQLKKSLGYPSTIHYLIQDVRVRCLKTKNPYLLRSKDSNYPLLCRPNSSDIYAFEQIFIEREYSCLGDDDISSVSLVIDCGANVGYSSAYFLTHFPTCTLIAVEPDASNFSLLEKNLLPYGDRVRKIHSAVWSHPAKLTMSEEKYRDGGEWTRQVRECKTNESPLIIATDIPTLLKESGEEKISILKIDIEGAEAVIFSSHYQDWIDLVDVIVIELHDDSQFGKASDVFYPACGNKFRFSYSGELIIGVRHK